MVDCSADRGYPYAGRVGGRTPFAGTALTALALVGSFLIGCGGRPSLPAPGFGTLSGRTVLVLPVQHVESTGSGWIGGARSARDAARQADAEIAFALEEHEGRASWVLPARQAEMLRRRPSIEVDPYALSTDEVRNEGLDLRRVHDPLYGEIRALAALFDTRYAVWPIEVVLEREGGRSRVAIRTLLLDTRGGDVLWQGFLYGGSEAPESPGALASAAQAFAAQVSP